MFINKTNLARTQHKKTSFLVPGHAQGKITSNKISSFQKTVLNFYKKHGRHHLPWRSPALKFRRTKEKLNRYRILVSEVMLQQTQVDRVIPYYKAFLKKFPTVKTLAEAKLSEVLKVWQGLGYNRRAKMLHDAAKTAMMHHSGCVPSEYSELIELPGVGDYTARAVRVFVHNEPETLIETNIRSVFIHHFFPKKETISDKEVVSYMIQVGIPRNTEPRMWYAALMDYGAHLKKEYPNPSRKSKHHVKQRPFKGSNREIRGALLRIVGEKSQTLAQLQKLPFEKERIKEQLTVLEKEGMLIKTKQQYHLP